MAYQPGNAKGTIAGRYSEDDGNRTQILDRARLCAALTKPWVLPPKNQSADTELPESYQSVGSRGMTTLVGKMLTSIFPPSAPWFQLDLAPEIRHATDVPDEKKNEFLNTLAMHDLIAQGMLDSAHLDDDKPTNRRAAGFRSSKAMVNLQLLVTGDVLEKFTDDYRTIVYRRDQYVTKRDSSGDPLYHIVSECLDPMSSLSPQQREKVGLKDKELKEKNSFERMCDMHTLVDWQPWTKTWVIKQEVKGVVVAESQETVSQYFSTPFDLTGGENYGRGFVEANLGDLRSLDNLERRLLDFAALCSQMLLALDESVECDDTDFLKPSGSIIRGLRVANGQIQNAAYLKVDKYPDFKVAFDTAVAKRQALGHAMLIESEITPQKERVTAAQVNRVAAELDGALGGFYAPIADQQQIPLVRRLIHQCRKDKLLPMLPPKAVGINVLTGLAALSRQSKLGNVLQFADIIQRLPPRAQQRLDESILLDVLARYSSIDEPGLVKSDEKVAQETKAAIAANTQQAAGEAAAQAGANIAEAAITQAATGQVA